MHKFLFCIIMLASFQLSSSQRAVSNKNEAVENLLEAIKVGNTVGIYGIAFSCPEAVNEKLPGGSTPLSVAVEAGCLKSVNALLDSKADPNQEIISGMTALHKACLKGNPEIVKSLVRHKADYTKLCTFGLTPLHYAAHLGKLATVKALLDAGVSPDLPDKSGKPPIWTAVKMSQTKTVNMLLEAGADVTVRYKDKSLLAVALTPSMKKFIAAKIGRVVVSKAIEKPQLLPEEACSVCLELMGQDTVLTQCEHLFCAKCYMDLPRPKKCPLCRHEKPLVFTAEFLEGAKSAADRSACRKRKAKDSGGKKTSKIARQEIDSDESDDDTDWLPKSSSS